MSRDARITITLIVILLAFAIVTAVNEARSAAQTPLLASSTEGTGAKALALWLDELGYDVSTRTLSEYALDGVSTLLMLAPSTGFAEREFELIEEWIDEGGTLVLAADTQSIGSIVDRLTPFELNPRFATDASYSPSVPLLRDAVAWDSAEIAPSYTLTTTSSLDYVTLLAYDNAPVAVTYTEGDGRVILTTLDDAFSNAGLKRDGNAELVLNLITLGGSAEEGEIWFDDWHHGVRGFRPTELLGPNAWLRRTFPGRAILYSGLLCVVLLIWRGRRLGRPMALPGSGAARAPLEYITAIANLNRRADTRAALQADYRQRLKRKLGVRYRIDPLQSDHDFLQALKQANPELDHDTITRLIGQLHLVQTDEKKLLEIIRETTDILNT